MTKEKALEIAHQYLAKHTPYELSFIEDSRDIVIYGLENPEDCYCLSVSDSRILRVGGHDVICIEKNTGKVYTGLVGE